MEKTQTLLRGALPGLVSGGIGYFLGNDQDISNRVRDFVWTKMRTTDLTWVSLSMGLVGSVGWWVITRDLGQSGMVLLGGTVGNYLGMKHLRDKLGGTIHADRVLVEPGPKMQDHPGNMYGSQAQ